MMTLRQFSSKPATIPAYTAWLLADLGEERGKQELFTGQAPQKLKKLREYAMVESAISSNRIEGVTVDSSRVQTILFGTSPLHDRDEEEVRGYQKALNLIHEQGAELTVSQETVCKLHYFVRAETGDAGQYKVRDGDIIEKYPDGRERVRFKTVPAAMTAAYMAELVKLWNNGIHERWLHPLLLLAAFDLDFLCIHPFRDGNGRVSRLLHLLRLYHLGYEAGRYISIERIIEENKIRYYETLEESSQGWHEKKHDPWPYINYALYTLKTAYREFEERVGQTGYSRGDKTKLIISAINSFPGEFTLAGLERACPSASRDMVRSVLRELQKANKVECLGRGPGALWKKRVIAL